MLKIKTIQDIILNTKKYKANLLKEIADLETKVNKLSDALANAKKKANLQEEIEYNQKYLQDITNLEKEKGTLIPLSAAMFILYGDEIIYLFSGSYDEYKNYFGQYRIQWEMISYAALNNYRRYNFYGIKDINTTDNEELGVLKFKQNFNGYIEELIGAYSLPINKPIYFVENIYSKICSKK